MTPQAGHAQAAARFLDSLLTRGWGAGDLTVALSTTAPSLNDHAPFPGKQATGLHSIEETVASLRTAFPDLRTTELGRIEDGNLAVIVSRAEGIHNGPLLGMVPTGRPVTFHVISKAQAGPEGVCDFWQFWEVLHVLAQLNEPVENRRMQASAAAFLGEPGSASSTEPNRQFAERHVVHLWQAIGNYESAEEFFESPFADHTAMIGQSPHISANAVGDMVRAMHIALEDWNMELHGIVAQGSLVADHWTIRGDFKRPMFGMPPTNRPVAFSGMDVFRVGAAGRFTDAWHVEDYWRIREDEMVSGSFTPSAPANPGR